MKAFTEKFNDFYNLTESNQNELLNEVLKTANNNPEAFKKLVAQLEFGLECPLPFIYEALSKDLENWGSFYVDEFQRLLKLANANNVPKNYLTYLSEFSYLKPEEFKERNEIVRLAIAQLGNPQAIFRYYAYNVLFDMYLDNDDSLKDILIKGLKDKDWRIRYWTHLNCEDFNLLPKGHSLKLTDRLRAMIFDTVKYG